MTVLIPAWHLTNEDISTYHKDAIKAFLRWNVYHGEISNQLQRSVRQLLPKNVGLGNTWLTPPLIEGSEIIYIDQIVPSPILLYGLAVEEAEPGVSNIKFAFSDGRSPQLIKEFNLECLYTNVSMMGALIDAHCEPEKVNAHFRMEGFFNEPIVIADRTLLTLTLFARKSKPTGDHLILNGWTLQKGT